MSHRSRNAGSAPGPSRRSGARTRKRLNCELESEGRRGRGIVLNLSESGLYVQTTFYPPKARIVVNLLPSDPEGVMRIIASVTRWFLPCARLRSVIRPALGLQIVSAPSPYRALIAAVGRDEP